MIDFIIVEHTCGQFVVLRGDGTYTRTTEDERTLQACPFCGGALADECLRTTRGRRLKGDDDER